MKLLDKYLFTQVLWAFLFGLGLVSIVWIAPELLPKVIREVVAGQLTPFEGFLFITYELPEVIVKSLPMGILIGSLLVFDRLSKDSEVTALRACGISVYRMLGSIIILGIIGSIIGFTVNETLVPKASLAQEKLKYDGKLVSNHFTYVDKTKEDVIKQVILIESFDGKNIKNIRIINFKPGSETREGIEEIFAAEEAEWLNNNWQLKNGIAYKLTESGVYQSTNIFAELFVPSNNQSYLLLKKSLKKPKNMNILEVKNYIELLMDSKHAEEARYFKVRYHQKYSQPLASIIMGIVGLILGIHMPRTSRFLGYTVGMFVILLYYFVWPLSMALGNIGAFHPFIAAWLPNFLAIVIGLIILKYKDF